MNNTKIITISILFLFIGLSQMPLISANIDKQKLTNEGWCYLSGFSNYAPKGLPDFSQRQHKWRYIVDGGNGIAESVAEGDDIQVTEFGEHIQNGDPVVAMGKNCYLESTPGGDDVEFWNFCFLVSLANCFWWLDSKYENPNGTPGDGVDSFPLVQDYGGGDDHSPENAPYLVCDLANLQGIACHNKSFTWKELVTDLEKWMENKGIGNTFQLSYYMNPTFGLIAEEITQEKPVILYIGFYKKYGNTYRFSGNHFVSCAGVNTDEMKIAFSDPFLDTNNPNFNEGWNESRSHNNPENVSHDVYQIALDSPFSNNVQYPPVKCWLPDYWPYYDLCTIEYAYTINEVNKILNPPLITGPHLGRIGKTYTYVFQNTAPDVDEVSYYIDWGDNNQSGWTSYRSSDDPLTIDYTWKQKSLYSIRAKVKDEHGMQSSWGELHVIIPKEKNVFNILFNQIMQRFPLLRFIFNIIGLILEHKINEIPKYLIVYSCSNPGMNKL